MSSLRPAGDEDWYEIRYEQIVADPWIQDRAWAFADSMRASDDPEISKSDVQASRAYVRRCIFNMSVTEASSKAREEIAALWGRGALGAARYRNRAPKPRRARRSGKASESEDD